MTNSIIECMVVDPATGPGNDPGLRDSEGNVVTGEDRDRLGSDNTVQRASKRRAQTMGAIGC